MKKTTLYCAGIGIFVAGVIMGIFITNPSGTQFVGALHRLVSSSATSASSTSYSLVYCPFCSGDGSECECCQGKGSVTIAQLNAFMAEPESTADVASYDDVEICKDCNGRGIRNSKICGTCRGEGVVKQ